MSSIDRSVIGTEHPRRTVVIERGRLRLFALAIGESDPVYTDVEAARAAGHPDLPAPPTFYFGLNLGGDIEEAAGWMLDLGLDLRHILHGEQDFTYHSIAHAGETLVLTPRITDVYDKRDGALQFIERTTSVTTDDGRPVVEMRELVVHRRPQGAS
ncbi:MaoC family dehydratase N-terminal domain-containing protein [Nocardioides sp. B-3]|uniref:MaoC family dehydratase N-terminal domain-containing protein n=1 Tax=Nocardioides sp. B-3 TaxID=2895565 RepID=UPI002152622F|nr:MaoC family dehydratase N-terminal domain-containing protein [Nocardioides sp. B-3]UUZ59532.1 MaoC family dehydratase N-terminal domain-containing protein [Nocardioides sp. B-3]